jgi:tRNA U34 5-methylaminomethyl-2-thiouridine-forming methyltransferase MnmC
MEASGVTYHSTRGAIQESQHVFMEAGLHAVRKIFPEQPLNILEMGFGTGLNAFMTAIEALHSSPIYYTSLETSPLPPDVAGALNYYDRLGHGALFTDIQQAPWDTDVRIHDTFLLHKKIADLLSFSSELHYHLIYFDAFAPEAQPELWTEDIFRKLAACTTKGGMLTTYCSKGTVRRAMQAAGWKVEKLPGPPGKREMVRAETLRD